MSYTDRFRTDGSAPARPGRGSSSSSSSSMTLDKLSSWINRACNPSLSEPNLLLNLDIAEAINNHKGQYPRTAAAEIGKLLNSRTPQTAILAVGLLDICVKNCGFPFHLQISRKEFLNEMVRKFPEKPPMHYPRVMMLILEQIEFWNETLCKTSRHRQDLGYVRDMHRLLNYKGYIFPEVNSEDAAVLNPNENELRSAAEIEEEEREFQKAKLQELVRRGTPKDLQEANHLMGILAGYKKDPSAGSSDFNARAAKDLEKLKRKADLLYEMLGNIPPGQQPQFSGDDSDVYAEIANALKQAQPKLNHMISDQEHTDEQSMGRLLGLNDYVATLLNKYDLLKGGHVNEAANVKITTPPGTTSTAVGQDTSTRAAVMESLIDIDDDEPAAPATPHQPSQGAAASSSSQEGNLIDALDGLSVGNIALGSNGTPPSQPSASSSSHNVSQLSASSQAPASGNNQVADEFDIFTSAGPVAAQQPSSKTLNVLDTSLRVDFVVKQEQARCVVEATFKNQSPLQMISGLKFQLAVTKSYKLDMQPITGDSIPPNGQPLQQTMYIMPPTPGLKLKWIVDYKVGTSPLHETGTLTDVI